MRQRILQAADHLGYRVNRLAQSLNQARSNVIGLVGTDLQQPFHAELLATLSAALLADGFQCMLLNAANAERDIGALIARVLEYRVSAIVVMTGTPPSRIVEEWLLLARERDLLLSSQARSLRRPSSTSRAATSPRTR